MALAVAVTQITGIRDGRGGNPEATGRNLSPMKEKDSILAEIQRLIDKQMEALKARLSPDDVVEYAERTKRIRTLLETIGRNHDQG